MTPLKIGIAALAVVGAAVLGVPLAAPALADDLDTSGMVYSPDPQATVDPNNEDYWDSGQHAGGTGAMSQDNGPSYNNQDQPTGGTGVDPGQPHFSIDHNSQAAGAF